MTNDLLLQKRLLPLLASQTKRYTSGESSSVPIETAQELLASLCFCLGIHPEDPASWRAISNQNLESAYQDGLRKIEKKIAYGKSLWQAVCTHLPPVENLSLTDTLQELGRFWRLYDYRFFAHEIPCSIDYQLCSPVPEHLRGIDYVTAYLEQLAAENNFLLCFSREALLPLLNSYCLDYKGLLINLFEPVAINGIGLALLHKNLAALNISSEDCQRLFLLFSSTENLKSTLVFGAKALANQLGITHPKAKIQLETCARQLTPRVGAALKNGGMAGIFLKTRGRAASKPYPLSGG